MLNRQNTGGVGPRVHARLEAAAVFNVKTISMSKCRGRKPSTLLDAARHNLREIHPERGAVNGIDPRRSKNNVILAGLAKAAEIQLLADELLGQVVGLRLKKDHVQAIETVFSVSNDFSGYETYFRLCLSWVEKALGLPVLSASIHLDQRHPHLHVLQLPVRDGQHVGGSPIRRKNLHYLRSKFFDEVAGPSGFQRANAKLHGVMKRLAEDAVMTEALNRGLPDQTGEFWPTLADAITHDPLPLVMRLGIDLEVLRRTQLHTPER
jgi:hypothetical protein